MKHSTVHLKNGMDAEDTREEQKSGPPMSMASGVGRREEEQKRGGEGREEGGGERQPDISLRT